MDWFSVNGPAFYGSLEPGPNNYVDRIAATPKSHTFPRYHLPAPKPSRRRVSSPICTASLDGGGGGGWQDDGLEAHLHHLLRGPQAPRRTPPGRPHLRPRLPRALVITRLTF